MMYRQTSRGGFTAVEVLITLFIIGFILASGYQAYALVTNDAGNTRNHAEASNIAYENLRRIQGVVGNPCTTSTSSVDFPPWSTLPEPRSIEAAIACPYGTADPVSLVTVTVSYGSTNEKVVHAVYAK